MFGVRLKQFAELNFGNVTAMAKALGISQPNITRYIREEVQPTKVLFERLLAVGCDIEWLLTGKEKEQQKEPEIKQFPVVSMVGAGSIIPYDDTPPVMMALPYKGEAVILKVAGESMAALISDGDLVLVDLVKRPKKGNIVAVRTHGGEQFVKYLGVWNKDIVMFYSHNAIFAPVTFKKEEILTIKKVVLILKDTDYPDLK